MASSLLIPPQLTSELELVVKPEQLLGIPKPQENAGEAKVLIKWKI